MTSVRHCVCLFVSWVTSVGHCVCLFVSWVTSARHWVFSVCGVGNLFWEMVVIFGTCTAD